LVPQGRCENAWHQLQSASVQNETIQFGFRPRFARRAGRSRNADRVVPAAAEKQRLQSIAYSGHTTEEKVYSASGLLANMRRQGSDLEWRD
jgi:hypothetical protein